MKKRKYIKNTDQEINENKTATKDASKVSVAIAAMKAFAEQTNILGLEGLRNSFCKLQARGPHPHDLTFNAQKVNRTKCRYHDIICLDNTRVFLKPWPEDQGDFIHANWINSELLDCPFICTQGPLNQTCGDFWRMVWQENVELIIMLCRTLEENRNKCAQYWPLNQGQVLTFCGITIRAVEKRTSDPDVHCTALLLTYRGARRPLAHYQWVSWPDRFVPSQLTVPYTLLSSARARKTPTVIHCSAGIGRTGTLVVLELLSRTLLSCRIPVVTDIIWSVRSQRSRAVQNEEQYLYIHYLTIQRLVNKGIVSDKSVAKFCRDYEQFYFTRTHRKQIPLPIREKRKKSRPKKLITPEPVTALSTSSVSPITISKKGSPVSTGTPRSQDVTPVSTIGTDSRPVQQQKKKKGTIKKKTPTQQQRVTAAKLSHSQASLQQEYQEAQKELLETYRKEMETSMRTQQRKIKDDKLTSTEVNVVQNAQKDDQALDVEVLDSKVKKVAEESKIAETETGKAEVEEDGSKSVYAFLSDEVRKIKQMEENPVPREDEIDTADYVFMQPLYARTYGAAETESRDVAEKYMMNMLPEEYFDRAMDDGAEYVAIMPVNTNKENTESLENLRKNSSKSRKSKGPN
ncbi:Protein-tyrosine phosphatase containing protein [Brugia malayi]|uniref:Bm6668 n=1 Tax=Brugia malayi TaxID=6279 RepID=A0A0J9XR48_BRUMA|nr:Protein-tyrosine phosphatase containing protein [Brugia malayi]CDP93281.2 Bm6668 [Brugia malayi]VIO92014.1 Protein-tyrosine phosphatase containing protein [Brugia malayi]